MSNQLTKKLLQWHKKTPRELPWSNAEDAYSIWLSEIIMQQTRVEYGKQYYLKFKELYPTVFHLAEAGLPDVMKAWEGLGYYSRARNLHHTARVIVNEYKGKFPATLKELQQLKGVGPYTAAAIGSFAFGISKAAIDGNAYRVLARYFGISTPIDTARGKREFQQLGDDLIDKDKPGTFNQAMMNFGALLCTPAQPDCNNCPVSSSCYAFQEESQVQYPVKKNKPSITHRHFTYFFVRKNGSIFIEERTAKDIWQNLYQFPMVETETKTNWQQVLAHSFFGKIPENEYQIKKVIQNETQQLSHQKIHANLIDIELINGYQLDSYKEISIEEIAQYPFPKLLNQVLKKVVT